MYKKVAFIGAPGTGKTTLAFGLYSALKRKSVNVEIVPELVKYKVYKGMDFTRTGFDIHNTLEQQDFEEVFFNAKPKIDYIISEAPLCNGFIYASFYEKKLESDILKKIAVENCGKYDLFFYVRPVKGTKYSTFGRIEDRKASLKIDKHISKLLSSELSFIESKVVEVTHDITISNLIKKLKLRS